MVWSNKPLYIDGPATSAVSTTTSNILSLQSGMFHMFGVLCSLWICGAQWHRGIEDTISYADWMQQMRHEVQSQGNKSPVPELGLSAHPHNSRVAHRVRESS
jgi:hypothetical protein